MRDSGPILRLPARPSCSWSWEEELLGTPGLGVGGTLRDQIGCGLPASSKTQVTYGHSLQVPHLCLDTGALDTTWIAALGGPAGQEPLSFCQPELKVGSGCPLVSPPLSLRAPLTQPQASGSGPRDLPAPSLHIQREVPASLPTLLLFPNLATHPPRSPLKAPAPLLTISSSSSSPGHCQTFHSPAPSLPPL